MCLVTNLSHRVTNATSNRNSGYETLKPLPHVKGANLKSLPTEKRECSAWHGTRPSGKRTKVCSPLSRQLVYRAPPALRGAPAELPGVGTEDSRSPHRCQQGEAVPTWNSLSTSSLNRAHLRLAATGDTGVQSLISYRDKTSIHRTSAFFH